MLDANNCSSQCLREPCRKHAPFRASLIAPLLPLISDSSHISWSCTLSRMSALLQFRHIADAFYICLWTIVTGSGYRTWRTQKVLVRKWRADLLHGRHHEFHDGGLCGCPLHLLPAACMCFRALRIFGHTTVILFCTQKNKKYQVKQFW